jgi:hypothetical protein
MKIRVSAAAVTLCALAGAIPVEPSGTIFENDHVKVVRALEKAHVKSGFHEHKMNRVMVYLQSGRQSFAYQDGRKPAVFNWTEGEVKWSPPEGMHSPEVLSNDNFNIVEVELKTKGSGKEISTALDPLKKDPKHYKLELENAQVRVLRVHIGPHETVAFHEHTLNRVTVFLTDQDTRTTDAHGKVETIHHKAGEAAWGTPVSHKEENLNDKPFEAVSIEIKG